MFTKVKQGKQIVIAATVLFADLRGYTNLSERVGETRTVEVLHRFYGACSEAVWERDGIVNKFIGDAVLAIFGFPIVREDHARQAVLAGMEIQKRWREEPGLITTDEEGKSQPIGVGIGIHTGQASIGEVGTAYEDFTIIGPVVNTASTSSRRRHPVTSSSPNRYTVMSRISFRTRRLGATSSRESIIR
jgi:class 3 adenylate cyclase